MLRMRTAIVGISVQIEICLYELRRYALEGRRHSCQTLRAPEAHIAD